MKMRILSGIVEIEGHYRGKDFPRLERARHDLNRVALDNSQILYLWQECEDAMNPCTIPHFGHSALCGEPCKHDALPWGVKRYFGVNILITGEYDLMKVPQAYRINEQAQFIPCVLGEEFSTDGEFPNLERIEKQ